MNMLKDIITYENPEYHLLKIKPDNRLSNTSYENIVKAIYSIYKPINERQSHEKLGRFNQTIKLDTNKAITYEVLFDGDNKKTTPQFYFGIPVDKSEYLKQRFQAILPNSTLTFVDSCTSDDLFKSSYIYTYHYTKDSVLALKTKENNFLESLLNLKNDIIKGEKILFQIQMTPMSKTWKSFNDEKWDKIRSGKDVATKRSLFDKGLDTGNGVVESVLAIMDEVMEYKTTKTKNPLDEKKEKALNVSSFSTASRNKKNDDGFNVVIKAYITGCNRDKANSYGVALETCMRELEEDNRLIVRKEKKVGSVTRNDRVMFSKNIMSGKECSSMVNIPNQRLQREFKIASINVRQTEAPKECYEKGVRIGSILIHGETKITYFPNDKNYLAMPKFYVCGMGGGKSNGLLNYADDVVSIGDALVDINFVDKCQLAYAIKERRPNHILINMADENMIPSFMLPEIKILDTDTPFIKKRKAGDGATEVEYILNSITSTGTENISTRMSQYLFCACKIVFIYNNMKIRTPFDILDDKKLRKEWIQKAIDCGVYKDDDYEIRKLRELDEGNNDKKIEGIFDRFSVLMKNSTFQVMLDGENPQFDFIDIMDTGKSISICMPEDEFRNKETKDIIITYLMSRLRLAMLGRKDKDKIVHVLIDEAHHLTKSLDVISDSIAEPRKYGVAFVFATHYFDQLGDRLKKAILNIGGHFILLKGVGESAFNELKSKIGTDYDYEDIKCMDDWNSFNMIWIRGQHYLFITKMCDLLLDKNGKKYI